MGLQAFQQTRRWYTPGLLIERLTVNNGERRKKFSQTLLNRLFVAPSMYLSPYPPGLLHLYR